LPKILILSHCYEYFQEKLTFSQKKKYFYNLSDNEYGKGITYI
jgi:hypothetical protein